MELTPPPNDDWPDYCHDHKEWCIRVINNVLEQKKLLKEMFGDLPTPTVPEPKKEEVKKKCHQVPKCVQKAMDKLKEDLMKVGVAPGVAVR